MAVSSLVTFVVVTGNRQKFIWTDTSDLKLIFIKNFIIHF